MLALVLMISPTGLAHPRQHIVEADGGTLHRVFFFDTQDVEQLIKRFVQVDGGFLEVVEDHRYSSTELFWSSREMMRLELPTGERRLCEKGCGQTRELGVLLLQLLRGYLQVDF